MRGQTVVDLATAPPGRPIGAPGTSGVGPGGVATDAVGKKPPAVLAFEQGRLR